MTVSTDAQFKRSLLGYRRRDVDEALAARDAALEALRERLAESRALAEARFGEIEAQTVELLAHRTRIDELERVADRLSERVVERERELAGVRRELARARDVSPDELRALVALATELEQVRRQARGQATRMRLRALREAAEIGERVAELARRPVEARERLLESLQEAIARIGSDEDAEAAIAAESQAAGSANGSLAGELFEGKVEVEVGPLDDFSKLVGFEDAAGGIGATSEISVKRFAKGRATLEVQLSEPVELLRELEERAPFEFRVRDQRGDRLVLDVDDE